MLSERKGHSRSNSRNSGVFSEQLSEWQLRPNLFENPILGATLGATLGIGWTTTFHPKFSEPFFQNWGGSRAPEQFILLQRSYYCKNCPDPHRALPNKDAQCPNIEGGTAGFNNFPLEFMLQGQIEHQQSIVFLKGCLLRYIDREDKKLHTLAVPSCMSLGQGRCSQV